MAEHIQLALRRRVTCPHCWENFAADETRWVSQHPELAGEDPRLGEDQQKRFLPTRFNAQGNALDSKGAACQDLACPKCHLTIPRALFELRRFFVSITGDQASGKSYLLASMTWQLRQTLPRFFQLAFADSDPATNAVVNSYEEENFLNSDRDAVVKLEKTQETGYMYNEVRYGEQLVRYPRPFFFSIRPQGTHPSADNSSGAARVITVYDNAGESFRPGADRATAPVTRHLTSSNALMFLFDPTQDPRFREACAGKASDPQIVRPPVTSNQEIILNEIAARIRRHTDLGQNETTRRPLILIVTKYDAWSSIFSESLDTVPWEQSQNKSIVVLDLPRIERVSAALRELLWQHCPSLVSSAEGLSSSVTYIPVSATGTAPEVDEQGVITGLRPRNIKPIWAEVPMLLALAKATKGLIPFRQELKVRVPDPHDSNQHRSESA